ncbi:MAG: TIGR03862 family flavoprotein [Pseudomonadota bacterium]
MTKAAPFDICVIGGGPAGLAAAEAASQTGARILLAERMPSLGRKFLMAGKSGLNLTKDERADVFRRHITDHPTLDPTLEAFGPAEVMEWAEDLGRRLFTGSSGRVFPQEMKASPLLRAWIGRLSERAVDLRTRWTWTGWDGAALSFDTPEGPRQIEAKAVILALGGASWARLGSDGRWTQHLDMPLTPFQGSNMGFDLNWSAIMAERAGEAVKPVALRVGESHVHGEFVVTKTGIEGSAVYAISAALRTAMSPEGATLEVDLLPDLSLPAVTARLARKRGKTSMTTHLRKVLKLTGVKAALLREAGPLPKGDALAARIKALPLHVTRPRPMDEAISTVGGIPLDALDTNLMLRERPGVFCAGEMLDWDAPTGGYLITTCLATGAQAGRAAARFALSRP